MDIHFSGLTDFCIDGAWRMFDLSPLSYSLVMHVPFGYHGIDYDGIADGTANYSMTDTNRMMSEVLSNSSIDLRHYIASYAYWHMLEWMTFISQKVASSLVNKVSTNCQQHSLGLNFEAYRCLDLIPVMRDYEQLLSPAVVENAVTAYMQSYIGGWWQDTVNFLNRYYLDGYNTQLIENNFLSSRYKLVKIEHPQTLVANSQPRLLMDSTEKKRLKAAKKAITRGRKLFDMLNNGKQTVDAFIAGEEIEVKGGIFDYSIRKTYGLLDKRASLKSIPYSLTLFDKESGLELACLCVYFDNTPILDQVYGFLMYISAGVEYEKKILATANVFMPTEAGKKSEKLRKYTSYKAVTGNDFCSDDFNLSNEDEKLGKLKAAISVFIFHKLINVSGLRYPNDCIGGVVRDLVAKVSFDDTSALLLGNPSELLSSLRENYEFQ